MDETSCPKCGKEFKGKSGHFYRHVRECMNLQNKPPGFEEAVATMPGGALNPESDLLASQGPPGDPEPENPTNAPWQAGIGQPAESGEGSDTPDPTTLAEVAEVAPDTESSTITEILPVPLTDAEYKEIGKKQALANQEIAQAENELKSVKSQYKSRIDSAEARRDEYAAIINAGAQQKQVECHLMKDFKENTITLLRLDTYEVVRARTMTAAEKQRGLDFQEGE
ncbi:MAG: hypothetical protein NTY64_04115 [Deltaproteobacteria bacterium]|nr:hypothetical protein [Deltaproteobacteria bacterium]